MVCVKNPVRRGGVCVQMKYLSLVGNERRTGLVRKEFPEEMMHEQSDSSMFNLSRNLLANSLKRKQEESINVKKILITLKNNENQSIKDI